MNFQNNGTFSQSAGTVLFTGNSNAYITGASTPQFYNLTLNKNGASLLLQNNYNGKQPAIIHQWVA